jgi:hypothetical protein
MSANNSTTSLSFLNHIKINKKNKQIKMEFEKVQMENPEMWSIENKDTELSDSMDSKNLMSINATNEPLEFNVKKQRTPSTFALNSIHVDELDMFSEASNK